MKPPKIKRIVRPVGALPTHRDRPAAAPPVVDHGELARTVLNFGVQARSAAARLAALDFSRLEAQLLTFYGIPPSFGDGIARASAASELYAVGGTVTGRMSSISAPEAQVPRRFRGIPILEDASLAPGELALMPSRRWGRSYGREIVLDIEGPSLYSEEFTRQFENMYVLSDEQLEQIANTENLGRAIANDKRQREAPHARFLAENHRHQTRKRR